MVVCVVRNSLDEVKSNINKIKDECYKINIYPRDIHTAAILYPNVIYSDYTEEERQQRHFLNGSIDQVGKDLQEVKIERPPRIKLSAKESLKRTQDFDKRKEHFIAAVRKGKNLSLSA